MKKKKKIPTSVILKAMSSIPNEKTPLTSSRAPNTPSSNVSGSRRGGKKKARKNPTTRTISKNSQSNNPSQQRQEQHHDDDSGTATATKERIYNIIRSKSSKVTRFMHMERNASMDEEVMGDHPETFFGSLRSQNQILLSQNRQKRETALRTSVLISSSIIFVVWIGLAGCTTRILLCDQHSSLLTLYFTFISTIFDLGQIDSSLSVTSLTFMYFIILVSVRSGIVTIVAGIQASKTRVIEDCWASFGRIVIGITLSNGLCFFFWYMTVRLALPLGYLNYVAGQCIVALLSFGLGVFMSRRVIPEIKDENILDLSNVGGSTAIGGDGNAYTSIAATTNNRGL